MPYDFHKASKQKLALADKILDLIKAEHPDDKEIQSDAIWLAFQAYHGPDRAGTALGNYGFNRSQSSS